MIRRIYYSHCISLYNSPTEKRDIELLRTLFPGDAIYNPNNQECTEAYHNYGMEYFDRLILGFDIVVFRGLPNKMIPAGIWRETKVARENNIPVIELPCYTDREMSVDDTRFFLTECGYR
jgi:hypothetical protein